MPVRPVQSVRAFFKARPLHDIEHAFLLFALIVHSASFTKPPDGRSIATLFVVIILLALTKPVYCSLALLAPIVRAERFPSRARAAFFYTAVIAALGTGAFLFFGWVASTASSPAPASVGTAPSPIDPGEQLTLAASRPIGVMRLLITDLIVHAPRYATHFVGRLGWLDTPLPSMLLGLYLVALILIVVTAGDKGITIPPRARFLAAAILTATVLTISLTMYAVWTPVGATTVEGVQGRYFLPIAPLAMLMVANRKFALRGRAILWHPIMFGVFNLLGLTATSFVIIARYYR